MTEPASNEPTPTPPRRPRRLVRRLGRWLLILLALLLLAAFSIAIFVNKIGLPELFKEELVAKLREKGWEVEFSRLRLRWDKGIVAEDVHLHRAQERGGPQFFADDLEVQFNHQTLREGVLEINGIMLEGGRMVWPLPQTNRPTKTLAIDHLSGRVDFLPDDQWNLQSFQARWRQTSIYLSGTVTNASHMRQWKTKGGKGAGPEPILRQILQTMEKVRFSGRPLLDLQVQGDAQPPASFQARLHLSAPRVEFPRGDADRFSLLAEFTPPPTTNDSPAFRLHVESSRARLDRAELKQLNLTSTFKTSLPGWRPRQGTLQLDAENAATDKAQATAIHLEAILPSQPADAPFYPVELQLRSRSLQSPFIRAGTTAIDLRANLARTNLVPADATGQLASRDLQDKWGTAQNASIRFQLARRASSVVAGQGQRGFSEIPEKWWNLLEQFSLDWTGELDAIRSSEPKLAVEQLNWSGNWDEDRVQFDSLTARLYGGELKLNGTININTRRLTASGVSDFDARQIRPLLSEKGQEWLEQYSWSAPPHVEAAITLTVPTWTNNPAEWGRLALENLQMAGNFSVGNGAFRAVPFSSAHSPFYLTNLLWHVAPIDVERPEGTVRLDYRSNKQTKDYHWLVQSTIDVRALAPLVPAGPARIVEEFEFAVPPAIEAEVWGRWHNTNMLGIAADVAATNFSFRGKSIEHLNAHVQYTNYFATVTRAELQRPEGRATCPGLGWNLLDQRLYITNAFSSVDPRAAVEAMGPKVAGKMADYRFDIPPNVRITGTLDIHKKHDGTDLWFEVMGGPFHWKKFTLPHVSGDLLWGGQGLTLTNLEGAFYDGRLTGDGTFDFTPTNGADFTFFADGREIDLHALMSDLDTKTNKLEGTLNGQLRITSANTKDLESWQGGGWVHLRDGLIWEIPIFGVFSPILNRLSQDLGFAQGLGNSRAREGQADFTITDGVIQTHNLEISSLAMRMKYTGSIGFDKRVNGRMEAELLREIPLFGPMITLLTWPVTKLFEYKITGTLQKPKAEPLYILPKLILIPFHPFRALKDVLQPEEKSNHPPEEPRPPQPFP